jgi:alpha-ketoglutarate-dependent taurine dioxygenase
MAEGAAQEAHLQGGGRMQVRRLSDVMGAEITGIDLSRPLSPEQRDEILDAFLEHHLIVFRDQNLTPEQQHAFTENFGELEGHVARQHDGSRLPLVHVVNNLDKDGRPTAKPHSTGNYYWHTDKSYHAVPSLATLLHAVEIPPEGGDTLFCNMYMAYDQLSDARRRELAGKRVVHSWEQSRINSGNKPASDAEKRERPPVTHPLVRTHPDTGRKLLYIGTHVSHIEGMPEEEGRRMLFDLLDEAAIEANIYRHKWQPGDLCMWDNRCLLHRADDNYEMGAHRRILHRTVVRGTVPV